MKTLLVSITKTEQANEFDKHCIKILDLEKISWRINKMKNGDIVLGYKEYVFNKYTEIYS